MLKLFRLLSNLLRKSRVEHDLDEEISFYLETLTQEGVAAGMSEQEARRAARLELGGVDAVKEAVRDVRNGAALDRIWQDLRSAIRALRKKPGFTAAAVLVLALGIGANSAVFSLVVNVILLKPLSVSHPEELIGLYSRHTKHPDNYRLFSYPNYVDVRRAGAPIFSGLLAQGLEMVAVGNGDHTQRMFAGIVSSNYFSTLGVSLLRGRPFKAEEERTGLDLPVILTYPYWRKTGEDPQILGKRLTINGRLFTIIGITPKGFTGTMALFSPEIYVPLGAYSAVNNGSLLSARDNNALLLVGRLKRGITSRAANAKLAVIASQMDKVFPAENRNWTLILGPLSRLGIFDRPSDDRPLGVPAVLLTPLAAVVLLIASLNLANMMMAKGAARRKEIAIRLAIGSGRQRIVQQLVTEALVLAIIGGVAGLFIASWSTTLLVRSLAGIAPLELVYKAAPDVRVVVVTLACCVASTVVFGLFPAWRLSSPDVSLDLKQNSGEDSAGRKRRFFSQSNMFVIVQLSLSLMMLTAAGLFIHSAIRAANIDPGFSLDNQVLAEVDASLLNYDEARARQTYGALRQRLRQVSGIQSVAMAATVPFGNRRLAKSISPAHAVASREQPETIVRFNLVSDDYFRTLEIPQLLGRSFAPAESIPGSKSHVVILDQLAAEKLWPNENAMGKQIRLKEDSNGSQSLLCEVVGVVGNMRESIMGDKAEPHAYFPLGQEYQADMQIHVKFSGRGKKVESAMLRTIRHEIRTTDGRLPVLELKTMREHLESSLDIWVVRTGAHMLAIFGGLALLLAVTGLYSINAYTVARRTREIGIRMAIGADDSLALRMILGEGLRVTAVGLMFGLLMGIGIGRALAGYLYGVSDVDPAVLSAACILLAVVALFACYVPARRASRVDPMVALRYE